jgi:hypothetical protein
MSYHAQCKAMLKFGISMNERENPCGLIETIPKPFRVRKWNLPMDEKKLCNTAALSPVKHSKRNNKECSWHNVSKECSLTVLEKETKDKTFSMCSLN